MVRASIGHVKIKIEPNEPGKGYEFVNAIVGGAIPKEYIPAVDNGIQGAMKAGVLAGYPVVDVKVTLWDGSYHEVDSSEMAFSIAGSMAFKEAMRKADPIITEPIMKVAVIVPDEYLGDVIGRPECSPRPDPRAWRLWPAPSASTRWCLWLRCSATPPTCAARPRAVASMSWSRLTTSGAQEHRRPDHCRPYQAVRAAKWLNFVFSSKISGKSLDFIGII